MIGMKRPSDKHIYDVYEAYERERAAAGRYDTRWCIQSAADDLGITYEDVRRVVLDRTFKGNSG